MVLLSMMLKTTSSFVLGSSNPPRTDRSTGGKIPIRSHLIEASGSSDAWYVPRRGLGPCGRVGKGVSQRAGVGMAETWGTAASRRRGGRVGENEGRFEHH